MNTVKTFTKQFFSLKPKRTPNADTKTSVLLSIAIVLTQVADYASTRLGLTIGATEANGTMAQFIHQYGYGNFLLLKLTAALFLVWTCWKRPFASTIIVLLYVAVVVNNLFVILSTI